jgi:dihydropteroate synthase
LQLIAELAQVPVERGPKDLRDLPEHFGQRPGRPAHYGRHDIQILAEINHAPRLSLEETLSLAQAAQASGADVVDVGCDPGETWKGIGDVVRAMRDRGLRVSVDSFNPAEVDTAVKAGAELVLSVNSSNREAARSWGVEVVAVPDVPSTLEGLDSTIEALTGWGVPFRLDPVLEPIGFGLAASLGRYLEVRRRYPQAEMMMGVGNLTELSDVDSAGINVLLLGFCQELGIRSVLTTEVINWCRTCVRELDLARRLVYHACRERVLPKHLEPNLVMLRDHRLFAEQGKLHVLREGFYLQGSDPFALFAEMRQRDEIDQSHAFYLGYEMAKAVTALTLGKSYVQDQALRWGFLTVPEEQHRGSPDDPKESGLS